MNNINARTIEVHEGLKDGGLPNFHHFDGMTQTDISTYFILIVDILMYELIDRLTIKISCFGTGGSLITIDIMLSKSCDFEGGGFHTLEADGELRRNTFNRGDALIFISHKQHCVLPIVRGRRQVLVLEFWEGEEKACAHRCEQRFNDQCQYSLLESKLSSIVSNLSEDL